jgi:maltodextrin utilization protein YvdJ
MRKLLGCLLALPVAIAFADSSVLDMNNLKCNKLQIYANTTLQQVQDNCLIYKQFDHKDVKGIDKFQNLYEVQFYSTTTTELVRCDFEKNDPSAVVLGCR